MRPVRRLIPFCAALFLVACAAPAPGGSPTPNIAGIPTFETPIGLLPGRLDMTATAPATALPPSQDKTQQVDMPTLGIHLTIPADWSSKQTDKQTTILDSGGRPAIEVAETFGLSADTDTMTSQLNGMMLNQKFHGANFKIKQTVVNVYNYVVVSGPEVDACLYAYLPVGLSSVALKFERTVCQPDGTLNDTAFVIWRSLSYTGPLQ